MTEAKRPLKVFLCHAHSDKDIVKALYIRLINDSVDTWLDVEKLLPGQDREYEIRKAVHESDVVVVCLSGQFNQAGFQQREVRLALDTALEQPDGEIFLIPARLEECEVPERLQRYHWVDLFDDSGYGMLMKALKLRDEQLERARIHKEDIVKRRLPYFETPVTHDNVMQREIGSSNVEKKLSKNTPLHESSVKSEFPESKEQLSHKKTKGKKRIKTEYVVAIIGAIATIIAGLLSSPWIEKWFAPVPAASATATLTITPQFTTILTPTETITPTVIPLPIEITDAKGIPMRLVPASSFIMGSDVDNALSECIKLRSDCKTKQVINEASSHSVYLDTYYIDKYETTNGQYKACVDAGRCDAPIQSSSNVRTNYYGNPEFDNYPVIYVNWNMAEAYCEWRDGQLPTEAQWEKAARGSDGRTFPWGEGIDRSYANYNKDINDTNIIGNYPNGMSQYGVYDMAGNVLEWVADWYSDTYYLNSSPTDPTGPETGQVRVQRGGSWFDDEKVRTTSRDAGDPSETANGLGFRCAKHVP